jgi:solute carrier family 25 folate transporter 32
VKLAVLVHGVGWGMYLSVFRGLQQNLVAYHGYESGLTDFVSACGAASATAFVATPLNFLKTRVQLHEPGKVADTSPERRGARALLRSVVKNEGYFVLFRGFGPQLLLSSHTTIQVGIYEQVKRRVWGSSHSEMPLSGVALTSGFARGVASCVCNPLEVVRTRLQDKRNLGTLQYASMGAAFRTIYCNEGVRGFYRGLWVNMMRVVPSTMCAFVIYEQVLEAHRVVTNHIRSNAEAKLLQQLPGGPQP